MVSHPIRCDIKAEIIMTRKDDNSILLWKCKGESQWEFPSFLLEETESFHDGIERWCYRQLGLVRSCVKKKELRLERILAKT